MTHKNLTQIHNAITEAIMDNNVRHMLLVPNISDNGHKEMV